MHHVLYVAAYFSQNMVPLRPDALVNMSVFCAYLRLEFGGKTILARLVHSLVNQTPELYFILTGPRY